MKNAIRGTKNTISECSLRIVHEPNAGFSIKMDPSCSYAKRRHNFSGGSFAILHRNYVNRFPRSFLDLRSFSDRAGVPVRLWIAKILEIVSESRNHLWRQYEWWHPFISLPYPLSIFNLCKLHRYITIENIQIKYSINFKITKWSHRGRIYLRSREQINFDRNLFRE